MWLKTTPMGFKCSEGCWCQEPLSDVLYQELRAAHSCFFSVLEMHNAPSPCCHAGHSCSTLPTEHIPERKSRVQVQKDDRAGCSKQALSIQSKAMRWFVIEGGKEERRL